MRHLILLLLIGMIVVSCIPEPEPDPPFGPGASDTCTIEVDVRSCPTLNCFDPEDLVGVKVELYESFNEAVEGQSPIYSDTTNQNGWVKFYDLFCHTTPSVRVDLGIHGVFVGTANFFNSNQRFDVITYPNYFYDFNQWGQPIVQEVSLQFPAVGQYSTYQYFELKNEHTFGGPFLSYNLLVNLQTYFSRQEGPNVFYVSESLSNSSNTFLPILGLNSNNYLESKWRFESDTLFVSNPYPLNGIISMIWNIREDEELVNGEYAIPLSNNSTNFLDLESEFEMPPPEWIGVGECSDYETPSFLFENLLVEKRNYLDSDGPLKYLVFSKEKGLVRSLYYSNVAGQFSSGFDFRFY